MNRIAAIALLVALVVTNGTTAQQNTTPEERARPVWREVHAKAVGELKDAVNTCIVRVRQQITKSRFDAYVDAQAYALVHTFGNQEELFHFDKCMTEIGHPLDP